MTGSWLGAHVCDEDRGRSNALGWVRRRWRRAGSSWVLIGVGIGLCWLVLLAGDTHTEAGRQIVRPALEWTVKRSAAESDSTYKLMWAPPTCGAGGRVCDNVQISDTGVHQYIRLNPDVDYRLHLPADVPERGGMDINGGHNVTLIGGQIDLKTPCLAHGSSCHGINLSGDARSTGEVFIEGVWIHNPDPTHSHFTGDGMDVDTSAVQTITLENIRVDGIDGCDVANPMTGYDGSNHSDVFQPYAATNAVLQVDHLTGTSDLHGMQINADLSSPARGVFKNVDMHSFLNTHHGCSSRHEPDAYMWWLTKGWACTTYPITLTNAYADEPTSQLSANSVWPDPEHQACGVRYANNIVTFPGTGTTGGIRNGSPPTGEFVPLGVAGLGYVSPGYMSSAHASKTR
jgi:hypothetical protein